MKSFALIFASLFSVSAFAAEPSVEITSFVYTGQTSRLAELCGKVEGLASSVGFVKITVDHKSKRPGNYHVAVDGDGSFCTVVFTLTGTAVASVKAAGTEVSSAPVVVGVSR